MDSRIGTTLWCVFNWTTLFHISNLSFSKGKEKKRDERSDSYKHFCTTHISRPVTSCRIAFHQTPHNVCITVTVQSSAECNQCDECQFDDCKDAIVFYPWNSRDLYVFAQGLLFIIFHHIFMFQSLWPAKAVLYVAKRWMWLVGYFDECGECDAGSECRKLNVMNVINLVSVVELTL